jgi:hypothetical protein
MRFERNETQVQNLLMQNIIVGEEIHENVKNCIGSPAGCIPESLQGN